MQGFRASFLVSLFLLVPLSGCSSGGPVDVAVPNNASNLPRATDTPTLPAETTPSGSEGEGDAAPIADRECKKVDLSVVNAAVGGDARLATFDGPTSGSGTADVYWSTQYECSFEVRDAEDTTFYLSRVEYSGLEGIAQGGSDTQLVDDLVTRGRGSEQFGEILSIPGTDAAVVSSRSFDFSRELIFLVDGRAFEAGISIANDSTTIASEDRLIAFASSVVPFARTMSP